MHALTNFEILDIFENNKSFGGVFSRDNLPNLENKSYIVNLNKENEAGSHWVAIYNRLPKVSIYFDSFGVYPAPEIEIKLRETGKDVIYNSYRIQHANSVKCGWFCLYFIEQLDKNRSFVDILLDFSNSNYLKNDEIISKLLL